MTARNSDLWPFLDSMRQMEDRFNHWAKYDYVFLNDDVSSQLAEDGAYQCRTSPTNSSGSQTQ